MRESKKVLEFVGVDPEAVERVTHNSVRSLFERRKSKLQQKIAEKTLGFIEPTPIKEYVPIGREYETNALIVEDIDINDENVTIWEKPEYAINDPSLTVVTTFKYTENGEREVDDEGKHVVLFKRYVTVSDFLPPMFDLPLYQFKQYKDPSNLFAKWDNTFPYDETPQVYAWTEISLENAARNQTL